MNILLTNDDGIYALGLRSIYSALLKLGHNVFIVAPLTEQSAVGHSLTVFQPLRVKHLKEIGFEGIGVFGTPTDCVKLALTKLLPQKPDLVISGINAGSNVGPDILYSGTVSAATEAAHSGYGAVAISLDNFDLQGISGVAEHAAKLATSLDLTLLQERCIVNINYPNLEIDKIKSLKVCPQTSAVWKDNYLEQIDPRGNKHWWLTGSISTKDVSAGSDYDLLKKGHVVITPLYFDFTHKASMPILSKMIEKI